MMFYCVSYTHPKDGQRMIAMVSWWKAVATANMLRQFYPDAAVEE